MRMRIAEQKTKQAKTISNKTAKALEYIQNTKRATEAALEE